MEPATAAEEGEGGVEVQQVHHHQDHVLVEVDVEVEVQVRVQQVQQVQHLWQTEHGEEGPRLHRHLALLRGLGQGLPPVQLPTCLPAGAGVRPGAGETGCRFSLFLSSGFVED